MLRSGRTTWLIFLAAVIAFAASLGWLSVRIVRLEQAEQDARAEAALQESLRLALWRMDSWAAPRIAREAARPYFEYAAYYPQQRAYTEMLEPIHNGDVLVASPLLSFESPYMPLHFQISGDELGQWNITSPQVPTGREFSVACSTITTAVQINEKAQLLESLQSKLRDIPALDRTLAAAESRFESLAGQIGTQSSSPSAASASADTSSSGDTSSAAQIDDLADAEMQQNRSAQEFSKRAGNWQQYQNSPAQQKKQQQQIVNPQQADGDFLNIGVDPFSGNEEATIIVGQLVPMYMKPSTSATGPPASGSVQAAFAQADADRDVDTDMPLALLLRRVEIGNQTVYQGVLLDWPAIESTLLEEIEDLFPQAELKRIEQPMDAITRPGDRMLATLPVELAATMPTFAATSSWSPTITTLALTWLVFVLAVLAIGSALLLSLALAERRSRFASAVTHELRTPLTTFRMYAEMLAENMVPSAEKRTAYLQTLRNESNRLSALVENVLAYARLERGKTSLDVQSITVEELLQQVLPALKRRAEENDMSLVVEPEGIEASIADSRVRVDPDVVGQILMNLVDNACKYADDGENRRIHLIVRDGQNGKSLELLVCDHGPGIEPAFRRAVFNPFDRGSRSGGDPLPGVGLGLSLSRGLARRLGGSLRIEQNNPATNGACFCLTLPAVSAL